MLRKYNMIKKRRDKGAMENKISNDTWSKCNHTISGNDEERFYQNSNKRSCLW
jgi:hypothetical protein